MLDIIKIEGKGTKKISYTQARARKLRIFVNYSTKKIAHESAICDPCRIQTCNPHIRSVVLYSVELMDQLLLKSKPAFAGFFSPKREAVRTRLELATYGVTGRYSNQLNYRTRCSTFQKRVQRYCFFLT